MKLHSKYGQKEIPHGADTFVTDDQDCVEVPDELGASLLEQVDAWEPAKSKKEG